MKGYKVKIFKVILTFSLLVICILYLTSFFTFSSYEDNTTGIVDSKIAKWDININEENITDEFDKEISIDDITWDNDHTESGKVSPGSSGYFTLEIDPSLTSLAFKYDVKFIDKTIDNDYVLTITSITSSDSNLIRTNNDTYTGLFTLNDVVNRNKKVVTVNLSWINNEENNDTDSNLSDEAKYIDLEFEAIQYNGEEIIEYIP